MAQQAAPVLFLFRLSLFSDQFSVCWLSVLSWQRLLRVGREHRKMKVAIALRDMRAHLGENDLRR
jgi:hypothetical protein